MSLMLRVGCLAENARSVRLKRHTSRYFTVGAGPHRAFNCGREMHSNLRAIADEWNSARI